MSRAQRKERRRREEKLAEVVNIKGDIKVGKGNAQRDTEPLKALNDRQQEYINSITASPVVICTGVWGSAKTYIPTVMACDLLLSKKIERIVIARPTEGKGKSIGYQKGSKDEKLEGWCAPVTETMKKRLGVGHFEAYLSNGRIELLALEQVKGRSWDDTFIIVDEAEDLDADVAKSLVGRQGINSKMVITGDIAQKDLKSFSGLDMLLKVAEFNDMHIPVVDFDDWEYCVRSEEAKQWGRAFEKYEESKQ